MGFARTVLAGLLLAVASPATGQDNHRLELARAQVEEQDVLGQLDRVDRQLHGLEHEVSRMQIQLDNVEARRLKTEDGLAALKATLHREKVGVAARCHALYRLTRRGLARALFDAESPADLRRRLRYLLAVLDDDRERLMTFGDALDRRQQSLTAIDRDRATIAALQAELRLKEAALRDERARKVALLQDVRSRRELAARALAQQSEAVALLGSTIREAPTRAPVTNASFRAAFGKLPWPTSGSLMRSFGLTEDPATGTRSRSTGIQVEGAYGTPFRAVFDGTVQQAGFIRGYGLTVVLDHGAYSTVYAHANGLKVSHGQLVSQGDVLGFVGNSGLVDASRYLLHFEIRYNGTPQDPGPWLGGSQ